jgi:hypothetical protein
MHRCLPWYSIGMSFSTSLGSRSSYSDITVSKWVQWWLINKYAMNDCNDTTTRNYLICDGRNLIGPGTRAPQRTRLPLTFRPAQIQHLERTPTFTGRVFVQAAQTHDPDRPAGHEKHGSHPRPRIRSRTGSIPWLWLRSPDQAPPCVCRYPRPARLRTAGPYVLAGLGSKCGG